MSNLCGDNVTQAKDETGKVSPQISYNDIATKLLQDRLLLTALELHTELVESGRELPKLKEFFSNPGNFEQSSRPEISSPIPRSGSQATLDSLDLTRFSEDGERGVDERVAVLEFELRKAKETITALRNNLTVATESESTVPDTGIPKSTSLEAIKPHEQRALNFLINEYLLLHGYKLTSITFADENENQDFEDWDDVGLNIPKPNELLVLYRDAVKHTGCSSTSVECQVNISVIDEMKNDQISLLSVQNEKLVATITELENEKKELQRQCDSMLAEQNKNYEQSGPCDVEQFIATSTENDSNSTNSTSPERFEMIDKPEKGERLKSESSVATLDDDESTVSLNENDADWTRVTLPTDNVPIQKKPMDIDTSSLKSEVINIPNSHSNRNLPGVYQKELYIECFKNISSKFPLVDDLLTENITFEYLVKMLTVCLPRIIPTMILKKREEVLPLLISAVNLNTSSSQRDLLLQQLFNLKKKPTEEERQKILAGIVHIAKYCGEHMIENEILPQCWEQINHKNVENRLLVIESCVSLAPYISSAIRNSLMLSMLQQMVLEDREKSVPFWSTSPQWSKSPHFTVRELAVQALALIAGLCSDTDKYTQFEDLALGILDDPEVSVVTVATNLLIPVLAKWALDLDKFQLQLMKKLFKKIKRLLNRSDPLSEEKITQILSTINILLPFVLISVTSVDAVINSITEGCGNELRPEFIKLCTPLTNPYNFYENETPIGSIVNTFESLILENDFESWPELDWFEEVMLQELLSVANHVNVSQENNVTSVINLFRNICTTFGKNFTLRKLRPLFESHIQNIESSLVNFNIENSSQRLCLIPVYLIGVLNKAEFAEEISNLIKRLVCVLPMSGTSSKCLEISIKGLCENTGLQTTVIASLWDGVVHQNPPVRCATANLFSSVIGRVDEGLLINRVAPALVTLASDPDVYVRTATIPCLGNLIISSSVKEVRDKAYMQLQSALTDPSVKEHHSLLCQLAATLGKIANAADPWFREEVILPQLAGISAYASQLTNQTRRKDLGLVLLEAFPAVIYSPLSKQTIATCLLPGLKYLESLETQEIASHHETISTMIRDAELRLQGNSTTISVSHPSQLQGRSERISAIGLNVNQSVEDMRQRMSKILKPNVGKTSNLTNLQGIFKKK